MLPFTKAESWPNIGFKVTAGSLGTIFEKAAFASSLGFGNFIPFATGGAIASIFLLREVEVLRDRVQAVILAYEAGLAGCA
jgi:hypothetical protein